MTKLLEGKTAIVTGASSGMTDDEALRWLEHHEEEYDYLVHKGTKK
jgi:NAD(P)-dependent dehydrogenase (short-subunit alcohol dehydrogenase family)